MLAIFNNIARETVSDFTYIMLNTINIESFETFVNSNAGIEMFNNIAKNIVFNIGMIEAISYLKATCPPKFIVECGYLNEEQKQWLIFYF